jgi:hypothetical protein
LFPTTRKRKVRRVLAAEGVAAAIAFKIVAFKVFLFFLKIFN